MVVSMEKTDKELRKERKELLRRRRRNDPGRYLFIGLLLILAATLLFLYQQHVINAANWLGAFITGLGLILIISAVRKNLADGRRARLPLRLIGGSLVLCYGLALLVGLNEWWPLALAIVGLALVFTFWFLQREMQQRRIVQETLQESEVKYRHLIDNANSIIMEIGPGGNIIFANKFARDFFGYKDAEMAGLNLVGTVIPAATNGKDPQATVDDIASHPENYLHKEQENLLGNGEKAWVIWTYKPVFDEENNLKEILCIGIDRTEQKKAEDLAAQQLKEKTAMEERGRLARDLHDAVSQTLFSASLIADVLPRLWEKDREEGLRRLEEVRQLTRGSLAEMRTLLFELRPAALADAGLGDLLRQLAEAVNGRARVPVAVEVDESCEIPTDTKIALYRIAQEALNNVAKHSGATRAQVTLHCLPGQVTLHIIDNGHGFDMTQAPQGGFGLGNMKERANQIGAALKIESKVNEGTEVTVTWNKPAGEIKNDSYNTDIAG
jgi:PAS domain S-box-containing protein